MYATFKIDGNDCRLAGIVSDGKVYKVPCHYNITLDKKGVKCYNTNLDLLDLIESVKRRDESDPVKKSRLFKETFSKFYIEQFKRVFEYMNGWDQFSKGDIGLADGLLGTLFPDLVAEGFEYYGRDNNGNVINTYGEGDPIDLGKLHKELTRIQGPDDSLATERYASTNPAPRRNVKKDYFNKA